MISVGITHYNRFNLIKDLFYLWQSSSSPGLLKCFEFIVVDDYSSVNQFKELSDYVINKLNHLNVKLFRHDENRGVGAAKNSLFLNAAFEHVFVLDSDNYISLLDIYRMYQKRINSNSLIVSAELTMYFHDRIGFMGSPELNSEPELASVHTLLFGDSVYNNGNVLIDKSVWSDVGMYPVDCSLDTQFFGSCLRAKGYTYSTCHGTVYWHRRHKNKSKSSYWRSFHSEQFLHEQFRLLSPLIDNNFASQFLPHAIQAYFLASNSCFLSNCVIDSIITSKYIAPQFSWLAEILTSHSPLPALMPVALADYPFSRQKYSNLLVIFS